MFVHKLLILLVASPSTFTYENPRSCGLQPQLNKIVGGKKTRLNEFPWMALLQHRNESISYFFCGGSLINKRYVLTAAHCFEKKIIDNYRNSVRLGEYDIKNRTDYDEIDPLIHSPPPLHIDIEKIIVHENYTTRDINKYNDIALLRLKQEVTFNEYVSPICLPSQELPPIRMGDSLDAAGWGITNSSNPGSYSRVKLKVTLPLRNNSYCERTYRNYQQDLNMTSNQGCAGGEEGKDACKGDSGGPLMKLHTDTRTRPRYSRWYAVGIMSFGAGYCGRNNWGSVYTKVANYRSWIDSKVEP